MCQTKINEEDNLINTQQKDLIRNDRKPCLHIMHCCTPRLGIKRGIGNVTFFVEMSCDSPQQTVGFESYHSKK